MSPTINRDRQAAGIRPNLKPQVVNKPTVLTTASADQLLIRLERTVAALRSLLIANERRRPQDVKCLANVLVTDLESQVCILQDHLAQLQDKPGGRTPIINTS